MSLQQRTRARRRIIGVGLAVLGSGIAFLALFLPWDYKCGIIEPACVPGPQDTYMMGPYSPTNTPNAIYPYLALVPFLGLFFALLLAVVPASGRRPVAVLGAVFGFCGLCGTLGMFWNDSSAWSDDPGVWHADWGIAVSVLGYVVLLAGIAVLLRFVAPPPDAAPPSDADDTR